MAEYSPEVEVDFQNPSSQQYQDFVALVDEAKKHSQIRCEQIFRITFS